MFNKLLQAYGQSGARDLPFKDGQFFKTGPLADANEKVSIEWDWPKICKNLSLPST